MRQVTAMGSKPADPEGNSTSRQGPAYGGIDSIALRARDAPTVAAPVNVAGPVALVEAASRGPVTLPASITPRQNPG
eukprot:4693424-Lingulodinium_polyedra.AAC.1